MKLVPAAIAALAGLSTAATATAQIAFPRLPVIFPLGRRDSARQPPAPQGPVGLAALQADLVAKSGSDTVYFPPLGYRLDANGMATLTGQARWLLANPFVRIRLEGHGGPNDSRDYALALGDRRANEVRDYLVLQGIAPQRIDVISWGKERPGTIRLGASVVAVGPRVRTVVERVIPPPPPAVQ
jgi:peptidoglycan-associated lipoprotein